MTRRADVLAAFARFPRIMGGAELARIMNPPLADKPCPWCPVDPPKPGNQCASVPVRSRRRAERVVQELIRDGLVEHRHKGTVMSVWVYLSEAAACT